MTSLRINPSFYKLGPAWRTWLAQARIFWLFLGVVVGVCLLVEWLGIFLGLSRIDRLPYAGWLLEMAGVLTVVAGFSKKIDLYGGDSISKRIGSWFLSCPLFRQNVNVITGSAELRLSPMSVSAVGNVGLPANADLEMRVSRLERMIDDVNESVRQLRQQTKEDIDAARRELLDRLTALGDELASVKSLTSQAHVGDVGMELAGIGWVLVGLTLATIPRLVLYLFQPVINILAILD